MMSGIVKYNINKEGLMNTIESFSSNKTIN